jgi:SAM-dependent methyltransferase
MTGESLWDIYQRSRTFRSTDRILEIGPGYGRLLKTALERRVSFASYTGVDLSPARVQKLNDQFGSGKIRFFVGDIDTWHGTEKFDVVICSSTFEHLYPDCRKAIENISTQLAADATMFIDFINVEQSRTFFEPDGTFIRMYSQAEARDIFEQVDQIGDVAIKPCTLGQGEKGSVERFVIIATSH